MGIAEPTPLFRAIIVLSSNSKCNANQNQRNHPTNDCKILKSWAASIPSKVSTQVKLKKFCQYPTEYSKNKTLQQRRKYHAHDLERNMKYIYKEWFIFCSCILAYRIETKESYHSTLFTWRQSVLMNCRLIYVHEGFDLSNEDPVLG